MSGTYPLLMGDRGRLVVPAPVREELGLDAGTPLVMIATREGLVLLTREQLKARVRADLDGADLVTSLLQQRNAEVEQDHAL